jgi:hypothetical protein
LLTHVPQKTTCADANDLLDHVVGAREQHRRQVEAECPAGRQVDDELEFGRLLKLNREVGELGAFQDATGMGTGMTMCSVGHQPTTKCVGIGTQRRRLLFRPYSVGRRAAGDSPSSKRSGCAIVTNIKR